MELQHRFTVPAGVEQTWTTFIDIEGVAGCFPGAVVTEADEESFKGTVKVKLGPIALVYNGTGTFVEKDEATHRLVIDAKGKDKRGNGTAGAMVTATMTEAVGRRHRRRGQDRPQHHRQGRPVRPRRRDPGRLRQAARPVRGLPRAAADRRAEAGGTPRESSGGGVRPGASSGGSHDRVQPPPRPRRPHPSPRRARRPRRPRRATTRSTWALPCCRCCCAPTGSRPSPSSRSSRVIWWLIARD